MAMADLKAFVGAGASDDSFVQSCWDTAEVLVNNFVGDATLPVEVLDRAILMVGSEMYHQRNAPQGVAQFTGMDGAPVRVARDPMTPAYSLLSQFIVVGF